MDAKPGPSAPRPVRRRKRRRRKLNAEATLTAYTARIRALPPTAFEELRDNYIGTFEVYNTVVGGAACGEHLRKCPSVRLMHIAREKGIPVKAVTSERKTKKRHVCHQLLDGDTRDTATVVYVGAYNYFTNHKSHPVFSLQPGDKVYLPHEPVRSREA